MLPPHRPSAERHAHAEQTSPSANEPPAAHNQSEGAPEIVETARVNGKPVMDGTMTFALGLLQDTDT